MFGFDSRRFQIFWEIVGLERGPLSLVSTIEELLGIRSRVSVLENREYGRRDPSSWLRDTPLSAKVGTNVADKLRSLGRCSSSRTQVTEFSSGDCGKLVWLSFVIWKVAQNGFEKNQKRRAENYSACSTHRSLPLLCSVWKQSRNTDILESKGFWRFV
jgi:hypothetical protein